MLIPSAARKLKACCSLCFKLLIHNFILVTIEFLMDFPCTRPSPEALMRSEVVPSPRRTTTHRGRGLCSAVTTAHYTVLSHGRAVTAAPHAPAIYHLHKIFILRINVWSLLWKYYDDGLPFVGWMQWSFGKQPHVLTYGEHIWINRAAKGIDWIHFSSISHQLLIMNGLVSIWPIRQWFRLLAFSHSPHHFLTKRTRGGKN